MLQRRGVYRWYVRQRTDDIRLGRDTMRNNLTDRPSQAGVPRDFGHCEDGARTRDHTGRNRIDYEDGDAFGRPVGVVLYKQGALLTADDIGEVIWRVNSPR